MIVRRLAWIAAACALLALGACGGDAAPSGATNAPSVPSSDASATAPASPTGASGSPAVPTRPPATATATSPLPPTPSPSATAVAAKGMAISNGSRSSGVVALTLDMGGRVDPAIEIMNWLVAQRIPTTIFMTGAMVENQNTEAGREVLRIIEKNPSLFELGSHSYSHLDFRELSAAQMADELGRTERAIAQHTKQDPRPLFRPPFGGVDEAVIAGSAAAGYPRVIMWDVDTIDWRPESEGGPTTQAIVSKVVTNARGGSIVLMHLGGYNTLAALPAMVEGLRAKGLGFATVSDLLSR